MEKGEDKHRGGRALTSPFLCDRWESSLACSADVAAENMAVWLSGDVGAEGGNLEKYSTEEASSLGCLDWE
ncbi:unnamed protein product [Gadus morhua 'NCC']